MFDKFQEWFDLDYSYENGLHRKIVLRDAKKCYKDWKGKLNDHFKQVGGLEDLVATKGQPPLGLRDPSHWARCCDRFASPEFLVIEFNLYFICMLMISKLILRFFFSLINRQYHKETKKIVKDKSGKAYMDGHHTQRVGQRR